jgi:2-dehydropantoate 2-reductase
MDYTGKMNIAIMDAEAIGSVIGGMLARQGHRVTLVRRKSHMDAISGKGLHISGIWGEHTVFNLDAVTSPPNKYTDIVLLTRVPPRFIYIQGMKERSGCSLNVMHKRDLTFPQCCL